MELERIIVTANSAFLSKSNRTWIFACTALALLIAFAVWRTAEKAMKMESASAAGPSTFESLKPGDLTKVVLQVTDSSPRQTIHGRLLEKRTETVYVRTGTVVEADYDNSTLFVMGKVKDVHPEAVLHMTGTVTSSHAIHARQIVLLTQYVQVR